MLSLIRKRTLSGVRFLMVRYYQPNVWPRIQMVAASEMKNKPSPTGEPQLNHEPQDRQYFMLSWCHLMPSSYAFFFSASVIVAPNEFVRLKRCQTSACSCIDLTCTPVVWSARMARGHGLRCVVSVRRGRASSLSRPPYHYYLITL